MVTTERAAITTAHLRVLNIPPNLVLYLSIEGRMTVGRGRDERVTDPLQDLLQDRCNQPARSDHTERECERCARHTALQLDAEQNFDDIEQNDRLHDAGRQV